MYIKYLIPSLIFSGVTLLTLFIINFFNIDYPVTLTTTSHSSEFSVVGEGKVDVVPDTAYVDVGITINNVASVQEAQQQINQVNTKIIDAMKKLNIPKENIKTSNYSISPNYDYSAGQNRITGYSGNVTISIKASDPQSASQVIEQATTAGANQVQGSRFVVENPDKYREEARDKAIQNAKDQAQKLAKDLGIRLGRITNIVESSGGMPGPYPVAYAEDRAIGMGGAAAPQLEPGSQTITSVVTLYFEKR